MFIDFLMPDDQEFGASLTDGSEVVSQHEIHVVSIKPVFPIRIMRVASLQLLVRGRAIQYGSGMVAKFRSRSEA